jgi:hypothetical protein
VRAYREFEEQRIKHLELIQAVISRLGNDAFLMKGWAVTVAGAFVGFAINSNNWGLALASAIPTVTFWGLDAYFLWCERLFRHLYARVRAHDSEVEPFFMAATRDSFVAKASASSEEPVARKLKVAGSWTLFLFYGVLLVAAVVVAIILASGPSEVDVPLPSPAQSPSVTP